MLDWSAIDTVLLDMDGTLLDLRYDNDFWNVQLKRHYANAQNITIAEAEARISAEFQKVAGTLNWYCLDYWEQTLQLPIRKLKAQTAELIVFRPDTPNFLTALQEANKRVAIITNAHPDALALKNQQLPLQSLCPVQFSTHEFGYCKEFQELWQRLQNTFPFDPERTLFVDDGEHILDSAKEFGIRYTLGIRNPDSALPARDFQRHPQINSFDELPKLG
ncbi:HAD family hydrolase [Aliidiomarina iranensis]|uniref:HAD family hydrolase n=1 Tax=Aliidiomarina iranensis TaxID=1434071 RepID=A0A432W2H5_9GAMM|nr:GMP/IMP nucleotidase [Aliidiomarina iranensis]RUO23408.1 HAD family hydrolase [Aliidiomarina iranensis]